MLKEGRVLKKEWIIEEIAKDFSHVILRRKYEIQNQFDRVLVTRYGNIQLLNTNVLFLFDVKVFDKAHKELHKMLKKLYKKGFTEKQKKQIHNITQ